MIQEKKMSEEIKLLNKIPTQEIDRVFKSDRCEIDIEFIGFINIYKNLSQIIPKHFTVIDFGCAYNPQSYYFIDHKKYIAVDNDSSISRFHPPNCDIFVMDIKTWIDNNIDLFDIEETFAICSYVPSMQTELVRNNFKNVFVFYPSNKKFMKNLILKMITNNNISNTDYITKEKE
jgi:hypothetical protein